MKRSKANDWSQARVIGNRGDKLDGHSSFPGCCKKEQEPNLSLLDISDLGTQLKYPGWRAQDE